MNTALWIIQALLAACFIMPGLGKISHSKQQHIADRHLKPGASVMPVRVLGILEWLGCVGIILPWLTGIMPVLTPVAAVCFCLVMTGGIVHHTLKGEYKILPLLSIILVLAAVVAYGRFRELHTAFPGYISCCSISSSSNPAYVGLLWLSSFKK